MNILHGTYELTFANGKHVKVKLSPDQTKRLIDALFDGETITDVDGEKAILTSIELLQ